ncbi:LppP/LprE family lipoprotein [Curtobacterium sp. RRHDQ10]|uniref:LppP/LprE family lipoprotein n=1 Tax=Curtobacterium phyllosphaerae TaxID=3413379 RepID=UPI003BF2BA6C
MWNHRSGIIVVTVGATALLLAGCSAASHAPDPQRPTSTTRSLGHATSSSAVPSTTPSAVATSSTGGATGGAAGGCGTSSASTAVQHAILRIPDPIPSLPSAHWDAANADVSGYAPCSALSWAVVSVSDGTPSSPNAILLFHDGAFLGTATAEQYPFQPKVVRTSDAAIAVTYRYPEGNDANANPSGTADATFAWDDSAGKVVMHGSVPPAS